MGRRGHVPDSPRLIRVLLRSASQGRSTQDRHGLCPGGAHSPVSAPSKAVFTLQSQAACSLVKFLFRNLSSRATSPISLA